jgi:hypothetical protein
MVSSTTMNETDLLQRGMDVLVKHLGLVEAERFISLVNRNRFDYTQWHGVLSEGKTIEEIAERAMKRREEEKQRNQPVVQ